MIKELKFASKELKSLLNILSQNSHQARIVGGSVRDALLEKDISDFDIATTMTPFQVQSLLETKDIRVIPTGIKHGTITALIRKEKFEITTLRKDVKCDGRWAEIEFTNSFKEDAQRRDFTINALSYDIFTNEVFDYFGGLTHLANRQVLFIGDPDARIREDYLRILRFFRFSSYYAIDFDATSLRSCNQKAAFLHKISRERINMEFDKILLNPDQNKIIKVLNTMQGDILPNIFPNLHFNIKALEAVFELVKTLDSSLDLDNVYGILLCQNNFGFNLTAAKFDNKRGKQIKAFILFLLELNSSNVMERLKGIWVDSKERIDPYVLLANALKILDFKQAQEFINYTKNTPKPQFPVNGLDVQNLGYYGKEVGNVLYYLKVKWIQNNFKLSKQELIKCV